MGVWALIKVFRSIALILAVAAGILLLLPLGFIAIPYLQPFILKSILSLSLPHDPKNPLTYQKLHYKRSGFVIDAPKWGSLLEAKQAAIAFSFHTTAPHFLFSIELDKPSIDLEAISKALSEISTPSSARWQAWLPVAYSISIHAKEARSVPLSAPQSAIAESFTGDLALHFSNQRDCIEFQNCTFRHVHLNLPFFEAAYRCNQVCGTGSLELYPHPLSAGWEGVHAKIELGEGQFQFEKRPHSPPFHHFPAAFSIQEGKVARSLVSLEWARLKGNLEVDGENDKNLTTLHLNGKGKDWGALLYALDLSTHLDMGASLEEADTHLSIHVQPIKKALEATGTLHFTAEAFEHAALFHFGGTVHSPQTDADQTSNGWFCAQAVPLETFLSPFIFPQKAAILKGTADLRGSFEGSTLTVKYQVEHIAIENEKILIASSQLSSMIPGELLGVHCFHLDQGTHEGLLPIKETSFLVKKNGMVFTSISGNVHFQNKALEIQEMRALSHGILFEGNLLLNYADPQPGVFDVRVDAPHLSGTLVELRNFISTFPHSLPLHQLPLNGEWIGRAGGLHLQMGFIPGDFTVEALVKGALFDGSLSLADSHIQLQDLSADVSYDHKGASLKLTDLQATWITGKPHQPQEYLILGEQIHLYGPTLQQLDIDIALFEREEELGRLTASTQPSGRHTQTLVIDTSRSHLLHLYPSSYHCVLKEWSLAERCTLTSTCNLSLLIKDLLRFNWHFPAGMVEKWMPHPELEGPASLALSYDPLESCWTTSFKSPQSSYLFEGRKKQASWIIDRMQWGIWSLYAHLEQTEEYWKVHTLGLQGGSSLLLALAGTFHPELEQLSAQIKLCTLSLDHLREWKPLEKLCALWTPQGNLEATGEMKAQWIGDQKRVAIETELHVNSGNLSIQETPIQVTSPLYLHFSSENGVQLDPFDLILRGAEENYPIKQTSLYFRDGVLTLNGLIECVSCPIQAQIEMNWPDCRTIQSTFYPAQSERAADFTGLNLLWTKKELEEGYQIHSIQGHFGPIACDFREVGSRESTCLEGSADIPLAYLHHFCKGKLKEAFLSFTPTSLLTFNGSLRLENASNRRFVDQVSCRGTIFSKGLNFAQTEIEQVSGSVSYQTGRWTCEDLMLQSKVGSLSAPCLTLFKTNADHALQFHLPTLTVKHFKPFLLWKNIDPSLYSSWFKTLLIKRFDLQEFCGKIPDYATWQGTGCLSFTHLTRKHPFQPLFAIPAEIILRLGLDPKVLTPISGNVHYQLKDARFYLTRLKEVYSEGKGSKFYLSPNSPPSWIDCQGNFSLHLRMKQYNLLFKIVELFTLVIKGNGEHPLYTLEPQTKNRYRSRILEKITTSMP